MRAQRRARVAATAGLAAVAVGGVVVLASHRHQLAPGTVVPLPVHGPDLATVVVSVIVGVAVAVAVGLGLGARAVLRRRRRQQQRREEAILDTAAHRPALQAVRAPHRHP